MSDGVDRHMLAAGIVRPDGTPSTEAEAAYRSYAEQFFRAGGWLSLAEFEGMTPFSRWIFQDARQAVEIESQTRLAFAIQNPKTARELASIIDGGEAAVAGALSDEAARLLSR